ncbi:hypothetical protein [Streptomyces sp. AA1529]|uniref:hypothetical protein n=1 Tax=Streptomyces sp. AA1529 TaxID=1203257 RepID=UPI003D7333BB
MPISSTRFPSATPRAASIENTIVGMELDEVGARPLAVPGCVPSSHWVVSGMSLCTFSHHSAGSVRRSITSPCRLPPAVPGHSRSGTNAARGTAR